MKPETSVAGKPRFISSVPWNPQHPDALVIHCGYFPYQLQIDDFVSKGLGLVFDRFAVPGGAQFFVAGGVQYKYKMADVPRVKFLHEGHKFQQIICIADAGCGWYADMLGKNISQEAFKQRQIDDLVKARSVITAEFQNLSVRLFFAQPNGDGWVEFEEII